MPFVTSIITSTTELIHHLHPTSIAELEIYIAGASYGSVAAQILYGASFDTFPLGRNVVGCLLLIPLSLFRWQKGYSKALSWSNYFFIGPPLIPRLVSSVVGMKMSSVESAEVFVCKTVFDNTSRREREAFAKWREANGIPEGEFERQKAEEAVKSVSKTKAGCLEVSEVLHSDWGFRPEELSDDKPPVLIVLSTEDDLASPDLARRLAGRYRNSRLREIRGGHIAVVYELDGVWKEFIKLADTCR